MNVLPVAHTVHPSGRRRHVKAIKRTLRAGACALAVSGTLLMAAPVAHAAEWHRVHTSDSWLVCQAYVLTTYGGWPADRVKCELDGPWSPFQTYGVYLYY